MDLVLLDPSEGEAEVLARIGIGALDVGVVAAPHDRVDADLVANRALPRRQEARADVALPRKVLRWRERHLCDCRSAKDVLRTLIVVLHPVVEVIELIGQHLTIGMAVHGLIWRSELVLSKGVPPKRG